MKPRPYIVTVTSLSGRSVAVGPFPTRERALLYREAMARQPSLDANRCAVVQLQDQHVMAQEVMCPRSERGTIHPVRDTGGEFATPTPITQPA